MTEKFREYCEFEYQQTLTAKDIGLVDKDFSKKVLTKTRRYGIIKILQKKEV